MKKILILVLLFTGSTVWAQQNDGLTAPPEASSTALPLDPSMDSASSSTASATSVVTPADTSSVATAKTAVDALGAKSSPTASWTVVSSNTEVPTASTAMTGTPASETASTSTTPTGTPSVMPKPPVLSAASTPSLSGPVGEHFVFQLDGGPVMPVSGSAASIYGTGFGFDARISYAFDDVFAIGLETGFYDLAATTTWLSNNGYPTGAASNMSHIPLLLTMQIYFGDSGAPIQPYLLLAGGLSIDADNLTGASFTAGTATSWVNFELDPAVGVAFMLDKNMNVFLQAKYAMDFGSNSGSSPESADAPIMLLPLQAGLNFNL